MHTMRLLALLLLCMLANSVYADWASFGVAIKCDQTKREFSFVSVVETSEPDIGTMEIPPNYQKLSHGVHRLSCQVGPTIVEANIAVYGGDNGMCMGGGYVSIESLKIANRVLLPARQPFNWTCLNANPAIVSIRLFTHHKRVRLETCTAHGAWEWGAGYGDISCHDKHAP